MTKLYRSIIFIIFLILPHLASAQFYVTGDDPGKAKWKEIETDNFKIIYPESTDSLARVYAEKLEKYRIPVSRTAGYLFNGYKMPVVMHAYNAANGSVAWAPKRMDLFTIPSAYDPEPMPWTTMLSVHESRHVAQMQFGMTDNLKPGNWFFGQMFNIVASLVYPTIARMEGDAVIIETALTPSGRGRTADFLNYYWVAFDQGDNRSWLRWRFPSQKYYGPDYYSLGYLTVGGMRYMYDCTDYMATGYRLAAHKPFNLMTFNKMDRRISGSKREAMFQEIRDTMYTLWSTSADARKPYIYSEPVTKSGRWYTDYTGSIVAGDALYTIRQGHVNTPAIVRIDSEGNEEMVTRLPYYTSSLQWSEDLQSLYWSETQADERWSLETKSVIRHMKDGKKHKVKSKKLLHNPAPTSEGGDIMTTRYEIAGKSYIDILNGADGLTGRSFAAPDTLQVVESAMAGGHIYASAISENGYGIYMISDDESWKTVLGPEPLMIRDLKAYGDELIFTSDRTGVNEMYQFDPVSGTVRQRTSLRYGASDFVYSNDGKHLYYSSQTLDGMKLFRTPVDSLLDKTVDFSVLHKYPIAEKVTQQEREFAALEGVSEPLSVNISEPKKYGKVPHMIGLHSWAPVYVNVDRIMNMSFDYIWQAASLGATGIFQNKLSTSVGEFGYSAHKDPYNSDVWRHSGHARITYSGLYPVLEAKVNVNDRAARQYNVTVYEMEDKSYMMEIASRELATPYVEGIFSAYIPLNLSSGGWYRGFIPKVTYSVNNDMFNSSAVIMGMETHYQMQEGGELSGVMNPSFKESILGRNSFRHTLSGSLRGYASLATPYAAVYPRWGIGAEVGASAGLDNQQYLSPMGYFYTYGYVPGLLPEHGVRLTGLVQKKLNEAPFGQAATNFLPRGYSSNYSLLSWISTRSNAAAKVTAEYAVPIYIGDIFVGGSFFAVKRLVVAPHFDYSFTNEGGLWSAGTELNLDLNSLFTLGWPCSIGLSASYNGGPALQTISEKSGLEIDRWKFAPTFNVTF